MKFFKSGIILKLSSALNTERLKVAPWQKRMFENFNLIPDLKDFITQLKKTRKLEFSNKISIRIKKVL